MEPAGAADSAHMSHLVLTHFSLLDIYLLNMNSINTCTRGWLVWKIKMALSGRGRVEIPLPSFVFLSSTKQHSGHSVCSCSLDGLQPYICPVLSSIPLWPFWTVYRLLSNVSVNQAKPIIKTTQQKSCIKTSIWDKWPAESSETALPASDAALEDVKVSFSSLRDCGLIHLDPSHVCRGGSSSTQALCTWLCR